MDPLSVLLFVLLASGAAILFRVKGRDRRMQALLDAATSCGLQVMEISGRPSLKARAGPLEVRLEPYRERGQTSTLLIVEIPGSPDFLAVRIRPEWLLTFPWARETVVGDEAFDSRFSLEGPERLIFALLDAETRRLLLCLDTECRVEISSGSIRAEVAEGEVPHLLSPLLDLGRWLAQSNDPEIPQRLAENAQRDPEAGVRLQNLLLLIHEYPGEPATVEVLRTACSDPSPEIRLRAAMELGPAGRDVLMELAESDVNDARCALAISALRGNLALERTTAILDHALRGRRIRTARACLEALGHSGDAAAIDLLAKIMTREKGDLAVAATQALGTTGNAAAEAPLIRALQREQRDLRLTAAQALGRVGSVEAVLPLKEAASWLDLDLHGVTRQAIAEIQARLQGASTGQLSLTGAEPGQLSLAKAEAGQLSLATDPAGQVSLTPDEPAPGDPA